jgi:hypothetical protein
MKPKAPDNSIAYLLMPGQEDEANGATLCRYG